MAKKKITKLEFSKRIIIALVIYAFLFTAWAFILMSVGMEVDSAIIVSIVGGLFGEFGLYIARAYLGKKNEEANNLARDLYEKEYNENGLN